MSDIDFPLGFRGVIVSDRKYEVGQGYEMTRTVKVHKGRPPVHTLRVVAHQGNSDASARATVERWDGQQWHQMVRLHHEEIEAGPSYVCWKWTRKSSPTALAHREDCEDWLNEAGNAALVHALEVL